MRRQNGILFEIIRDGIFRVFGKPDWIVMQSRLLRVIPDRDTFLLWQKCWQNVGKMLAKCWPNVEKIGMRLLEPPEGRQNEGRTNDRRFSILRPYFLPPCRIHMEANLVGASERV